MRERRESKREEIDSECAMPVLFVGNVEAESGLLQRAADREYVHYTDVFQKEQLPKQRCRRRHNRGRLEDLMFVGRFWLARTIDSTSLYSAEVLSRAEISHLQEESFNRKREKREKYKKIHNAT